MSWQILNNKIKSKLEALSDIQVVYDYPWVSFDGYPAVTITPSDMESDYQTNQTNMRTYSFTLRAFMDIEIVNQSNLKDKVSKTTEIMRGLVDTIIDTFDSDETLTGISADMPSGKTLVTVRPVPGRIVYFEEEKMMIGEITLDCVVLFDTTS